MLRTADQIIRRFDSLASERVNFESVWQEIADHVKGSRDFTTHSPTAGRKRNVTIYDNTAMLSGDMLASALHNFLTNTATKWFSVAPEDDRLMEVDGVMQWFEFVERQMNAAFNRPESRFVPQMHENYIDLVFFCTSVMFVEDVPGLPVRFSARPLSEIFVAEDPAGRIDTVYRKFKLTHRQALDKFGRDKLPKIAKKAEKNPDDKTDYLHLVHRRDDPIAGRVDSGGMPWRSVHVGLDDKQLLSEGGFWEMPYLVARWEKEAGELYGRGPGWNALPEAKMLNEMSKTVLKAAQKVTDPPLAVADDGVMNPINTSPGGINVIRTGTFSNDPIRPLPIEPNIPVGVEMMERRKTQVRGAFMHDLLQILQDPRMTATQVIEISERAQALIAPILGRMQVELLEPMIERVFGIMNRAQMLPPAPPIIQGVPMQVQYISPVARAQRGSEVRSIVDTLGVVGQVAQMDPTVMDNINVDEAAKLIVHNTGAPARIARTRREVEELRAARAQMQQQQQQHAQLMEEAEAVGKAGPTAMQALEMVQGQ